jgi:LCP family protein required for cell wall assembly
MGLPGEYSQLKPAQAKVPERKLQIIRRWTVRAFLVVLVLSLVSGGSIFALSAMKVKKVFKGGAAHATGLTANVNPSLLKGEGDGRINILLMGRGGGTHDAPDLTDTMMLASVDPIGHTTTLISIPRDLWVKVPGHGSMKINAAWETGEFDYLHKVAPGSTDPNAIAAGNKLADSVVTSVLGIQIHYNVIVDFQAFRQAVDTVGGVTVNVPTDLYDPTMAWENNNNPLLAKAGVQTFDGKHALIYVRSRETTSDFARSQRQRSVMLALKDKVVTLGTLSNPIKISELLNSFGNNVATDFSLNDASRLYSITKDIPSASIKSVGMADAPNHYITTGNMNGQSIDKPVAGLDNYTDIQNFIRTQLPDGYLVKENAKILVLNGTALPGVATAKATILKSYGYNVIGAGTAPTDGWTQTTIVDLTNGKDKYTSHYLQQRYNAPVVTKLPDTSIQTNGADFVIIIGSDEASTQD